MNIEGTATELSRSPKRWRRKAMWQCKIITWQD